MLEFNIKDWYGDKTFNKGKGYTLKLFPGYTSVVGPNGAGKTTLFKQIREEAKTRDDVLVYHYSNLENGGSTGLQHHLMVGNIEAIAGAAFHSEGEAVYSNFAQFVTKLQGYIKSGLDQDKPVIILIDGIDSGASIDKLNEYNDLFKLMIDDAKHTGSYLSPSLTTYDEKLYILVTTNNYELVKNAPGRCLDPASGMYCTFNSYDKFAKYICDYFKHYRK